MITVSLKKKSVVTYNIFNIIALNHILLYLSPDCLSNKLDE